MNNIAKNYWKHEVARWNRHPVFWTAVTVGYAVYLAKTVREIREYAKWEKEHFPPDTAVV